MKLIRTIFRKVWDIYKTKRNFFFMMYQKNFMIDPATGRRAKYWAKCGAHIGKNVNIGSDVYFDASNAKYIYIEDNVWIASRSLVLCHRRDISDYHIGDKYLNFPFFQKKVVLRKGCSVGMGSIIMPGVTIGEGALIGAGSVVTKDIPAWSVAVGNPAKVIKELKNRENE